MVPLRRKVTYPIQTWTDLTVVKQNLVSFQTTFVFERDGAVLTSDSTLRFRSRAELADSLAAASLIVEELRDAPAGPDASSSSSPTGRHNGSRPVLGTCVTNGEREPASGAREPKGPVLVVEDLMPEERADPSPSTLDIIMLTMTAGRERTADQLSNLFDAAGFELARVIGTRSSIHIVEAKPT